MEVLHVALGLSPFVQDAPAFEAVAGLAKAQKSLGHDVTAIVPLRPAYAEAGLVAARRLTPLSLADGSQASVHEAQLPSGVGVLLIDAPELRLPISEETLDEKRARGASLFAQAVAALLAERDKQGRRPDLLHVHDAEAALCLLELEALGLFGWPSVFSVHDARRPGTAPLELRSVLRIPVELVTAQAFGHGDELCLLKGLLGHASQVIAPSAAYARDLCAPERHGALARVFQAAEPIGIGDGVDLAVYNPATDPVLRARYDAADPRAKGSDKSELQLRLELDVAPERPLFLVGSLASQSDEVKALWASLPELVRTDAQLVLSTDGPLGTEERERLRPLEREVRVVPTSDRAELRRLLSGADFYVSLAGHDPSAIKIKQAARYGAIPVALASGGAIDAVVDADAGLATGTGFLLDTLTRRAIVGAVTRAVSAFGAPGFLALRKRVMRQDLGWDRPARQVLRLAQRLRSPLQ